MEHTILIQAVPAVVWEALTNAEVMKTWMGAAELKLEVQAGREVGAPVQVSGHHHGRFKNKGVIKCFEPFARLQYTHLSSVSRLPDREENYTVFTFLLEPEGAYTRLTIQAANFPTEAIAHHLNFYWRVTIHRLKAVVEKGVGA